VATAGGPSLPEAYAEALRPLLGDCPPEPFAAIKEIVEDQLGPLAMTFEQFDEVPIRARPLGQTHSARLHRGQAVLVKVRHLRAERAFRIDMHLFVLCARLLAPELLPVFEEMSQRLVIDFDYSWEALLQREVAASLAGCPELAVPLPLDGSHPAAPRAAGLCTKSVLVIERPEGVPLADWAAKVALSAAVQGRSEEFLTDTGPSALLEEAYNLIVDFGSLILCTLDEALQKAQELMGEELRAEDFRQLEAAGEAQLIAKRLLAVQGHMIFRVGMAIGDDASPNLLVSKDGHLSLVECGQILRLSVEERCLLAGLVIAVAVCDEAMVADCMRSLGLRTEQDLDWSYNVIAKAYLCSRGVERGAAQRQDGRAGVVRHAASDLTILDRVDRRIQDVGVQYRAFFRSLLWTQQVLELLGVAGVSPATLLRRAAEECLERAGWPVPRCTPCAIPVPLEVRMFSSSATSSSRTTWPGVRRADPRECLAPTPELRDGSRTGLAVAVVSIVLFICGFDTASKVSSLPAREMALPMACALAVPLMVHLLWQYANEYLASKRRSCDRAAALQERAAEEEAQRRRLRNEHAALVAEHAALEEEMRRAASEKVEALLRSEELQSLVQASRRYSDAAAAPEPKATEAPVEAKLTKASREEALGAWAAEAPGAKASQEEALGAWAVEVSGAKEGERRLAEAKALRKDVVRWPPKA